MNTRKTCINLC